MPQITKQTWGPGRSTGGSGEVWPLLLEDAAGTTQTGAATLSGQSTLTGAAQKQLLGAATLSGQSTIVSDATEADSFANGGILDNFNRADNTSLGANWTNKDASASATTSTVSIGTSRAFAASVGAPGNVWNTAFNESQEVYATVQDAQASEGIRLYARVTGEQTVGLSGYRLTILNNAGTGEWYIARLATGASVVSITGQPVISDGDKVMFRLEGSVLQAWHKVGGTWTEILHHTDGSPITGGGKVGIGFTSSTTAWFFDDFGGGSVPVIQTGAATLSGQSSLTGAARIVAVGAASFSGQSTLVVAALKELRGASTLSGQSTLTAAARLEAAGVAALSGQSTLTAAAVKQLFGSASLSGQSTLTAAALKQLLGAASLSGESTLMAAAVKTLFGASTLSGQSTLTVAASLIASGQASLAGQSTLTAAAVKWLLGAATLSGQSSLTASPVVILVGAASLSGQSSMAAAPEGNAVVLGTATLSGDSTLIVVALREANANATLSGQSALTAAGLKTALGQIALSGESGLVVIGLRQAIATAILSGQSNLFASVNVPVSPASAILTGQSGVFTFGHKLFGQAATNGHVERARPKAGVVE